MKRYIKSRLLDKYKFLCTLIIGIAYILLNIQDGLNYSYVVFLTFIINGVLIILRLMKTCIIGYNLEDMIWIYCLSFLFISPLIQFITQMYPWGDSYIFTQELIVKSNFVVLIFIIIFIIFNKFFYQIVAKVLKKNRHMKFNNIKFILDIAFYLSVIASVYIIYKTGFSNLFSRSTNSIDIENMSVMLIISNTFRAIPVISVALNLVYKRKYNRYHHKNKFLILLILAILINFPTGIARNKLAVVYIGLMLVLKPFYKNKYFIKYLILFGLLFIFPLVNIFRTNTFKDLVTIQIALPNPTEDFIKGDFDSYSMLARTIYYADNYSPTYGKQLLGSIFFFIPRTFWPNKPVGSGYFLATNFGWKFKNVSSPFIAEGYINFGIVGVIFFAISLAFTNAWLNTKYSSLILQNSKDVTLIEVLYPFMLGFLFFIMRGDLLSSLSYTIAFIIPAIAFYILDKIIQSK